MVNVVVVVVISFGLGSIYCAIFHFVCHLLRFDILAVVLNIDGWLDWLAFSFNYLYIHFDSMQLARHRLEGVEKAKKFKVLL